MSPRMPTTRGPPDSGITAMTVLSWTQSICGEYMVKAEVPASAGKVAPEHAVVICETNESEGIGWRLARIYAAILARGPLDRAKLEKTGQREAGASNNKTTEASEDDNELS